jgi:hypothetical protein
MHQSYRMYTQILCKLFIVLKFIQSPKEATAGVRPGHSTESVSVRPSHSAESVGEYQRSKGWSRKH